MNHNPFIHDHNPFCPFTVEGTLFRHGQEIKRLEANKQDKLTAGPGILIDEDNIISATGGGGGGDSTVLDLRNEIASADNLQPLIDELATESIDTILLPANYDPEVSGEIIELDIPTHVKTITAGGTDGFHIPRYFIKGTHRTLTLNNGKFTVNNSNRNGFAFYANNADLKDISGYPQIYFRGCTVDGIVPTGGVAEYTTFTGEKGFRVWNPVTLISCFVNKMTTSTPPTPVASAMITAINTEFRGTQTIPLVAVFNAQGCKFGNVTITNSRVVNISGSTFGNLTLDISYYAKLNTSDKPLYTISGSTIDHLVYNNARYTTDEQPLVIIGGRLADEPETNAEIKYSVTRVGDEWR